MPKNSRMDVSNKCRICLGNKGPMVDIFTAELIPKIKELTESSSIHINDGQDLPRRICHICLYKLEMWCDFKKQFIYSHKMLLQHLKSSEGNDHAGSGKRRHSDTQKDADDTTNDVEEKKKFRSNIEAVTEPLESFDNGQLDASKKISPISFDDTDVCNITSLSIGEITKFDMETTSGGGAAGDESQMKLSPIIKSRVFSGRRTSEQRLASTQRWVARKKALLAATGENDSDTDSMGSDNTQLSPIQKARSKNQQAEKEVERLRRLSKSLNNFGTIGTENNDDNDDDDDDDDDHRDLRDDTVMKRGSNNTTNINEMKDPFESHTIQSELVIGDATFIVTSKLLLSEPQYLNQSLSDVSKIPLIDNMTVTAVNSLQQNTDIIDAVQLRRVNRTHEKNFVERCLNIEVEGTDLLALQRIQIELDNYLMTDMKNKLLNNNAASLSDVLKAENTKLSQQPPQDSFQTLEQQLKTIVEKAIRKNLEVTKMRRVPISKIATSNRGNKIFSAAFIKAAMKSQIFQPKVVLNRVETIGEHLVPAITDNTSLNDCNSEITCSDEITIKNETTEVHDIGESMDNSVNMTIVNDYHVNKYYFGDKKTNFDGGHYSCSICNELFATKFEIERHLNSHKYSKNAKTPINIISKRKMMRCKRCHEIVESRYVKTHICEWKKSLYRCFTCDASFKNEYLLVRHLKVHEELAVEDVAVAVAEAEAEVKEVREERAMMDEVKIERVENLLQMNESIAVNLDLDEHDDKKNILKTNINIITYTCFVCDKNFTDEELLKDHLQQHCDDVSDDDNKDAIKDQLYQCAICGEALENETALGYHVEKHLFDDSAHTIDDKDLVHDQRDSISIKFDDELAEKFNLHTCVQCNEQFDNEINLALHVQGHEEESAIAEWEKHGFIRTTQVCADHTCTICDDTFDSEAALAQHIDIHNESSHICLLCDKPFLTLAELQDHVDTH